MAIKVNDFEYRTWLYLVREQGIERRKAIEWMLYKGALGIYLDIDIDRRKRESEEGPVYVKRHVEEGPVYVKRYVEEGQECKKKRTHQRMSIGSIPSGYVRVNLRSSKYVKFNNKDSREIMDMRFTHFSTFLGADDTLRIKLTKEENAEAGARRINFHENGKNLYATLPVCKSCEMYQYLRDLGFEDNMCQDMRIKCIDGRETRVIRMIGSPKKEQRSTVNL